MFEIGKVYSKAQLHEQYGTQEIKDICTQKDILPIFIFTGDNKKNGEDNGKWVSEDTYVYTDHLMNSNLKLKPESKEYVFDSGDVYLFKHINDEKVELKHKMKLVKLNIETGYDEEGSYTERIKYELRK